MIVRANQGSWFAALAGRLAVKGCQLVAAHPHKHDHHFGYYVNILRHKVSTQLQFVHKRQPAILVSCDTKYLPNCSLYTRGSRLYWAVCKHYCAVSGSLQKSNQTNYKINKVIISPGVQPPQQVQTRRVSFSVFFCNTFSRSCSRTIILRLCH